MKRRTVVLGGLALLLGDAAAGPLNEGFKP